MCKFIEIAEDVKDRFGDDLDETPTSENKPASESDGFGFIASVAVIEQELRLSLTLERLLG